ncbi:MAG: ferritin family protein [Fibrobacterota bacterium]
MDAISTAIQMEEEGIAFFEKMIKQTEEDDLKGVFRFLRDQEIRHRDYFRRIADGDTTSSFSADKDSVEYARSAFSSLKDNFDGVSESLRNSVEAYKKARAMEAEAVEFYTGLREEAQTDQEKESLQVIIDEEKKHEKLMDAMVDFVAKPDEWLENAEFFHLDKY